MTSPKYAEKAGVDQNIEQTGVVNAPDDEIKLPTGTSGPFGTARTNKAVDIIQAIENTGVAPMEPPAKITGVQATKHNEMEADRARDTGNAGVIMDLDAAVNAEYKRKLEEGTEADGATAPNLTTGVKEPYNDRDNPAGNAYRGNEVYDRGKDIAYNCRVIPGTPGTKAKCAGADNDVDGAKSTQTDVMVTGMHRIMGTANEGAIAGPRAANAIYDRGKRGDTADDSKTISRAHMRDARGQMASEAGAFELGKGSHVDLSLIHI